MSEPTPGPPSGPGAAADGRPLYEQWAAAMTEAIRTGAVPAGHRLPSERVLAEQSGYTRLTVRRGLQEMARGGLLQRAATRGWEVIAKSPVSEPPQTLLGFSELARSRGLRPHARVLGVERRPATLEEAEPLRVAPGAVLVDAVRLRLMDTEPVAVERSRMPLSRLPWLDGFDWSGSVYEGLDASGHAPHRSQVTVDVHPATAEVARWLGVPAGRGLLRLQGVTADAEGEPVSLDDISYHPDRYRFRAVLERPARP